MLSIREHLYSLIHDLVLELPYTKIDSHICSCLPANGIFELEVVYTHLIAHCLSAEQTPSSYFAFLYHY